MSFEIKDVKRVINPTTFQPMIEGKFAIGIEAIQDLRNGPGQGLSKETYVKELLDYVEKTFQTALEEYDNIIKEVNILFESDPSINSTYGNTHKTIIHYIPKYWVNIGIVHTPCFKNFMGEAKENITYKTSVRIPRAMLGNVLLNGFKEYFIEGLNEVIEEEGIKYYYTSLLHYLQEEDAYALLIRGAK